MFAGHAQQTMSFFYAATRFFTNTQKEKEKKNKMIEQKEKYTLCSANVQTDFAPHSGPFPCRHPLWNHKRVFRDDFQSFFTHTHPHTYAHTHTRTHAHTRKPLLSAVFLAPFHLVLTVCIQGTTFSLHIAYSQRTSTHFADSSQASRSYGQHLEFSTQRTGFSSYRKCQLY